MSDLSVLAKNLVAGGKGIFAADASPGTLEKRAGETGLVLKDEAERRRYREVLFTTRGLGQYIGGVIMHEESTTQKTADGKLFTECLEEEGIVPGVKVDKGIDDPAKGLEGLPERLAKYYSLGARLTKWRAVINEEVTANAEIVAKYALLSQQAGLVPIVEPEVLMDGEHTIEKCQEVTEMAARAVFEALVDARVELEGILYKTNMVVAGKKCIQQPSDEEIAKLTVETLRKVVSVRVPGVVFLSGGQEPLQATKRLNLISHIGAGSPWRWTFSYERALEGPVMKIWQGKDENKNEAQKVLLHRAKMNSLASLGKYKEEMENSL